MVAQPGAQARARLDQHVVAGPGQLFNPHRQEPDAIFIPLGFFRHADDHGIPPMQFLRVLGGKNAILAGRPSGAKSHRARSRFVVVDGQPDLVRRGRQSRPVYAAPQTWYNPEGKICEFLRLKYRVCCENGIPNYDLRERSIP